MRVIISVFNSFTVFRRFSFAFSLSVLSFFSSAQEYSFKRFEIEQGLSHNTVLSSFQDSDGFIWAGTKAGLNRFDGYNFKHFVLRKSNGKSYIGQEVHSITSDADKTIWVGASNGLFYFNYTKQELVNVTDTVGSVYKVFIDQSQRIWLLTETGVYIYQPSTNKCIAFQLYQPFHPMCMSQGADGRLWFGMKEGMLLSYSPQDSVTTLHNLFEDTPESDTRILSVKYSEEDKLLIGTSSQGLKEFDMTTGEYINLLTRDKETQKVIFVRDILLYGKDEAWLATESGIYIVSLKQKKVISIKKTLSNPYSLSDNAIYTLCKDFQGGIWVGTYFGGLQYYSRKFSAFERFFADNSANSISGKAVRAITEDRLGNLWIGTEDAGLNRVNSKTGRVQRFLPSDKPGNISHYNIHGLLPIGDELWVGTYYQGLDVLDINTGKIKKHFNPENKNKRIRGGQPEVVFLTSQGELLVGTERGVSLYDRKADSFYPYRHLPQEMTVNHITEDKEGGIWVGTSGQGFFYVNPLSGEVRQFMELMIGTDTLPVYTVNDLMIDSRHQLWICPENEGLIRMDIKNTVAEHYSTDSGLPSNFVFKTIEDDDGFVWATSGNGLLKFSQTGKLLTVYTIADGLLSNQFNYASGFKDRNGKLYFGSPKGMIAFRSQDLPLATGVPPFYITDVMAGGRPVVFGEDSTIILQHNHSALMIRFAALDYTAIESIQYSYKMEGIVNDWTTIKGDQVVSFSHLPAGRYTFKVKAYLPGRWKTSIERNLSVEVKPPVWASTGAYLFYVVLLTSIVFGYIRYVKNRESLKAEVHRATQLESFNAEILVKNEELQQLSEALNKSNIDIDRMIKIIAHDLRNPIVAIAGYTAYMLQSDKNFKEAIPALHQTASNALLLVDELLKLKLFPSAIVKNNVKLTELLEDCVTLMTPVASKKSQRIVIEKIEVEVEGEQDKLARVFINLLSNAIKFSREHQLIQVAMQLDGTNVVVSVRDNGIGIPASLVEKIFLGGPEIKRKGTSGEVSFGLGLNIVHQIVYLHKGRIWVESQPNIGTTFFLSLPVKK